MVNWESSLVELRLDRRPGNLQQREEREEEFGIDSHVICVLFSGYIMFNLVANSVCVLRL